MPRIKFMSLMNVPVPQIPKHTHILWEAAYYLEGDGSLMINKHHVPFREGQLVLIPPNALHGETSSHTFRNTCFLFTANIPAPNEYLITTDNENRDIQRLIEIMYRAYHLNPQNWEAISEGILDLILQLTIYNSSLPNFDVEKMKEELSFNISNPHYNIESVYEGIKRSPGYMRKLFQKSTGYTPLQYLTIKRVEYAKNLLDVHNGAEIKINIIAKMVGFEDPYYFSRVFKKVTGIYPSQYSSKKTNGE